MEENQANKAIPLRWWTWRGVDVQQHVGYFWTTTSKWNLAQRYTISLPPAAHSFCSMRETKHGFMPAWTAHEQHDNIYWTSPVHYHICEYRQIFDLVIGSLWSVVIWILIFSRCVSVQKGTWMTVIFNMGHQDLSPKHFKCKIHKC